MGRKKREENDGNGTAVLDLAAEPNGDGTPTAETAKNRPAVSFAAMTDRTTRVEVAVWARVVKVSEIEEYTQYSMTISRAWRDLEGRWTQNSFYRAHDLPVQLYLIQKAYEWCLAQRATIRSEPGYETPF